ncbi:MAG: hypothetical protein DHS20C21_10310 [Gemmatimonadota bacterium]|nr:MAG: hypothetical protein DHS20C21_10310 [Gemmatimonadota bacterium]
MTALFILGLVVAPVPAEEQNMEGPVDIDTLWDYNDPAGTEQKFRELRPAVEAAGDVHRLLELDTQIARTYSLQRRFDEANALLDTIEPALETAPPVVRIRYLLERGRTLNSSGSPESAKPLFVEAWELGRPLPEVAGLAVDAAHMVAITEKGDEALRWNETALAHAQASDGPKAQKWKGSLLNNLGWTYHDSGNFDRAYELFVEAAAYRRAQEAVEPIEIADWCVARCLRSLGRVDEALEQQRTLLARKEERGAESDGYVFEELGECLLLLGRPDEARPWFAKAHQALSQDPWLVANEAARLDRLSELAAGDGE